METQYTLIFGALHSSYYQWQSTILSNHLHLTINFQVTLSCHYRSNYTLDIISSLEIIVQYSNLSCITQLSFNTRQMQLRAHKRKTQKQQWHDKRQRSVNSRQSDICNMDAVMTTTERVLTEQTALAEPDSR